MLSSRLRLSISRLSPLSPSPDLHVLAPPVLSVLLPSSRALSLGSGLEASGRNKYIRGGSNKQDISLEVKELISKARDTDDLSSQLGHGIEEPLTLDLRTEEHTRAMQYEVPYKGYATKMNNGINSINYYPYTGEELPSSPPSPVLMVTKVKSFVKEPYWVKSYCEQVGLGSDKQGLWTPIGTRVFLPNLPSVGLLLYRIKHVVDIQPITFPNGMPDDFDPDKHGFKLNKKGEFIIEGPPKEGLESVAARADWMKIEKDHVDKEARLHWDKPFNSPLGNSNYHVENNWMYNSKSDSEFVKNQRKKWS